MTPDPETRRTLRDLVAADDAGWNELDDLLDRIPREELERPGYFEEGWSAKDLVGHLGSWLAEASVALTQLGSGTYRPSELDIDAKNEEILEALRALSVPEVRAQASAAHTRMLQEMERLTDLSPDAVEWIEKAGARHYEEHLPRLRAWANDLARVAER